MSAANTEQIFGTKRLLLRKFRLTDIDDYWEFVRQAKDDPTSAWPVYANQREAMKGLQKESRSSFDFAIVYKENNKVVGAIKLIRYKKEERSTIKTARGTKEICYILNKKYWRQGIMPEAMQAVVEFAFLELNIPEIVTCHAELNVPSGKVQERLGFNIAGRIKNFYIWADGTPTARIQRKMTHDEFMHRYMRAQKGE